MVSAFFIGHPMIRSHAILTGVVLAALTVSAAVLGVQLGPRLRSEWRLPASARAGAVPALPTDLSFSAPEPRATVGFKINVAGAGGLTSGVSWWVAHRNADSAFNDSGPYFTFIRPERTADGRSWVTRQFQIGSPTDCGHTYVVYLLALPADSTAALDHVTDSFSMNTLPAEAVRAAHVDVKRQPCR